MTRTRGAALALVLTLGGSACAKGPAAVPRPPEASADQKLSWILRFEDQRVLRDPEPDEPPATAPAPTATASVPPALPKPDLLRLLSDPDPRIRRRAALAVGRVGLAEGTRPLVAMLADPVPEVRQMAAFALGIAGDSSASEALLGALRDASPLVQGSAAEALGLLGDKAAAAPIARLALEILQAGALTDVPGDQADVDRDSPAAVFRLAMFALANLNDHAALASAALDEAGRPRVGWWPVAYALQRIGNPAAQPALRTLAADPHPYTRMFAIKGLGATKDKAAVPLLLPLVASQERLIAIEAIRALGSIGDPTATKNLLALLQSPKTPADIRLEAILAISNTGGEQVADLLIDSLGDPSPQIRAASLHGLSKIDPQGFVFVLSGLDPDPNWSVRAMLATVLGTLSPEAGLPRLRAMLNDRDQRVLPAVLAAIALLHPPDAVEIMAGYLKADDVAVRGAAAKALGELMPPQGPAMLGDAYRSWRDDQSYVARAAALTALARYKSPEARVTLNDALSDPDWAVRIRAADLLHALDPAIDSSLAIRPAPTRDAERYTAQRVINPKVSPLLLIDTDRGTIQIEMAVLDAPQTVDNLIALARKQFFDGLSFHRVIPGFVVQTGDPRGDGEGGPGYTIRDELNDRSYVRGTVGMALDWKDTGGSQFFITQSPQPHLDGRYTVIGRVTGGMEIVDQIEAWDVMRRVRVWDGETAP